MPFPPKDAIFKEQYMFRKFIFRMYCLSYTYEQSANEGVEYYKNELSMRGYTIKKLKENELAATNGDILIRVGYDGRLKQLSIYFMIDDIFDKLNY